MDPQHPPLAIGQNLQIPARLRRLHYAKCELLSRHREVGLVIAGHLKEYAAIRTALISLTCRVLEAGTESQARGDVFLIAHAHPYGLQRLLVRLVHLYIT